jgi:hypothetical protein
MGRRTVMSYIWEDYDENNKYVINKSVTPYLEVFDNSTHEIAVNPLLRFASIFGDIITNLSEYADINNVALHYLAMMDKSFGMNYFQMLLEIIRNDFINGYYGQKVKNLWEIMNDKDKNTSLYYTALRLLNDDKSFFMEALGKSFPASSLAYDKESALYFLYIGAENTSYNKSKLELLITLFANINMTLKLKTVWKYHYGVIGDQNTMRINAIQIV